MKFFAVFSCIVAVAMASTSSWTINELSQALQNPSTDQLLVPILEQALNDLMLEAMTGNPQPASTVSTAVQDFTLWTLNELSEAIQDQSTDPALVPYLEHALNNMMTALMAGEQLESVIVGTPVGLLPVEVLPAPVVTPAEAPVSSASSPLVQIIVNVKSQQQAPIPEPVIVAPIVQPNPVDVIAITPPEAIVNPVDVIAINPPQGIVNPVDVIAINPTPVIVNPVDVVAVAPPEINPVDILSPVPVVSPIAATHPIGPLV